MNHGVHGDHGAETKDINEFLRAASVFSVTPWFAVKDRDS